MPSPKRSPSANGSSKTAHFSWSAWMKTLCGSICPRSGERPKKYSGWRMMNWSVADEEATSTDRVTVLRRPARPACCQEEAMVPGKPASTDASRPPMSMPSSSALVDTTPWMVPSRRPRSIARRSLGRYPPR